MGEHTEGKVNHVSIHAPARGATVILFRIQCLYRVSIHAPARGATVIQKTPLVTP